MCLLSRYGFDCRRCLYSYGRNVGFDTSSCKERDSVARWMHFNSLKTIVKSGGGF